MIAVTGATGFIGTRLCEQLLKQGYRVRALVRTPAKAEHLASLGASLTAGDLHNPAALRELAAGCDALVHSAGAVRGSCQADFDRVNVAGTEAVVTALIDAAPRARLLMLSSLTAREPALSWYGHSKRESETLLEQRAQLDWVILRPPAVYGPGDKEMLPVFQSMARGIALVPGSPDARASLIHVSDLVHAMIACLQSPAARHCTLYLGDGKEGGYTWREMAAIAGEHWSRRVRLWQVPAWLLNSVAGINLALAKLTGRAPMLTPPKLRELRHPDWGVDNQQICSVTEWQPQISLRQGLELLNFYTVS